MEQIHLQAKVTAEHSGQRCDRVCAELFPDFSRARLQEWLASGELLVNGATRQPKQKVYTGDTLVLEAEVAGEARFLPQEMPLNIVYEDDSILVVNKQSGLVVHPAAGNPDGTLLNGLLFHAPELDAIPRAGIVHRLDKDTTGLMVVAKTIAAQTHLVRQLQSRKVKREYRCLCLGTLAASGTVNAAIGRHPTQRVKMAVVKDGGKEAVTHYEVRQRFRDYTELDVRLETGRTHQIRVHMAHLRHPLVGDSAYAGRPKLPKGASSQWIEALTEFNRQALHAKRLAIVHPKTKESMQWEAPLPDDYMALMSQLQQEHQQQL